MGKVYSKSKSLTSIFPPGTSRRGSTTSSPHQRNIDDGGSAAAQNSINVAAVALSNFSSPQLLKVANSSTSKVRPSPDISNASINKPISAQEIGEEGGSCTLQKSSEFANYVMHNDSSSVAATPSSCSSSSRHLSPEMQAVKALSLIENLAPPSPTLSSSYRNSHSSIPSSAAVAPNAATTINIINANSVSSDTPHLNNIPAATTPTTPASPVKETYTMDQLTTFEAFGITIPSLVLSPSVPASSLQFPPKSLFFTNNVSADKKSTAAQQEFFFGNKASINEKEKEVDKEDEEDDEEDYVPPPPPPANGRRRWSVAEPPVQRRWTVSQGTNKAIEEGGIPRILQTVKKRSMDDLIVGGGSMLLTNNDSKPPLHRPKSILKSRNLMTAESGTIEPSRSNDPKIIVDFGGDVIQHSSTTLPRQSIMSSLVKINPIDEDAPEVRKKLATELSQFEERLKQRMQPSIFLKGEFIIKKHDIGKEMFFLSKGNVEILSSDEKTQYGLIKAGSFFGKERKDGGRGE